MSGPVDDGELGAREQPDCCRVQHPLWPLIILAQCRDYLGYRPTWFAPPLWLPLVFGVCLGCFAVAPLLRCIRSVSVYAATSATDTVAYVSFAATTRLLLAACGLR